MDTRRTLLSLLCQEDEAILHSAKIWTGKTPHLSTSTMVWFCFGITSFRRDHFGTTLFRCQTFSAQIISAPISCYLTVHLFRIRVSKKHQILAPKRFAPKWSRQKVMYPSVSTSFEMQVKSAVKCQTVLFHCGTTH